MAPRKKKPPTTVVQSSKPDTTVAQSSQPATAEKRTRGKAAASTSMTNENKPTRARKNKGIEEKMPTDVTKVVNVPTATALTKTKPRSRKASPPPIVSEPTAKNIPKTNRSKQTKTAVVDSSPATRAAATLKTPGQTNSTGKVAKMPGRRVGRQATSLKQKQHLNLAVEGVAKEDVKVTIGAKRKRVQGCNEVDASPAKRPNVNKPVLEKSAAKSRRSRASIAESPVKSSPPSPATPAAQPPAPTDPSPKKRGGKKTVQIEAPFATLSTKLEKLKSIPSLQTKKSLGSKEILSILDDFLEDKEPVMRKTPISEARSLKPQLAEKSQAPNPGKGRSANDKVKKGRTKKAEQSLSPPKPGSPQQPSNNATVNTSQRTDMHVPIWKKSANISQLAEDSKADVFDVGCYGVEEFGPEDERANVKKKQQRRKKKETKAILVFGSAKQKEIEKAVKETHNLKTPGRKRAAAVTKGSQPPQITISSPAKPRVPAVAAAAVRKSEFGYSSDFSTGAHNFFDSVNAHQFEMSVPPVDCSRQPQPLHEASSRQFTTTAPTALQQSLTEAVGQTDKSYKTPSVPKTFSKFLKNDKSSTPRMETVKPAEPVTIKEQIKNAFGFDDTDDDDLSGSESMLISPVKKVAGGASMRSGSSFLEDSSRNHQNLRMSAVPSIHSGSHQIKIGPSRFVGVPVKSTFMREVAKMERQKIDASIARQLKKSRTSPRKKKIEKAIPTQPPSQAVTTNPELAQSRLYEDAGAAPVEPALQDQPQSEPAVNASKPEPPVEASQPRNAFEVLKSAKSGGQPVVKTKKLIKKAPKKSKMDQSSICEASSSSILKKVHGKEASKKKVAKKSVSPVKKASDKENSSMELETSIVTKTYRRKMGVSFDTSIPVSPSKKVKKKEKKLNAWAALQTSHFSEVEEFDLSFS